MSGVVSFNISVITEGLQRLPELEGRLKDLAPVLENLINEWAESNEDKFDKSHGAEVHGVSQDDGVFWRPLTHAYWVSKARAGFDDWLMVRTGSLRDALTSPDGFFRAVSEKEAVFGVPMDPDDAIKALNMGNWDGRQAIFLNHKDRLAIKREVMRYFELGEKYRKILFARGVEASQARAYNMKLDMAYNATVGK